MKKNMLRSFDLWPAETFNAATETRATILFLLAWFHAIVQERRKFIPQGWVKFYEFSVADLRAGSDVIAAQCTADCPDWETVYGVFSNAIYGGRLDNDYDIRILDTYLRKYFNNTRIGLTGERPPLAKGVTLPVLKGAANKHQVCLQTAQHLRDTDAPELFDLPPNADRMVQKTAAMKMIEALGRLKDEAALGFGTFNAELWAARLKPLFAVWETATEGVTAIFEPKDLPKKEMSPLSAFVWMEVDMAYQLVTMVNDALTELQRILAGKALLTQKLHGVALQLMAGEVPVAWDKAWEGPENVQVWLRYVAQRAIALQDWLKRSEGGTLLSSHVRSG
eukprot:GGOE01042443.1.p2 GENE.GGOE01042443.1~~GGOE01042443.1.p2  ORF type:complete len:336 (-),score=124.96 GGOE01042443.1:13-1020(-)